MEFLARFKRTAATFLMMVFAVILYGCGGSVENTLPKNAEGHSLEDFAPLGSNFVLTYSTMDSVQKQNLDVILEKLSLGEFGALYKEALNEALGDSEIQYDDIKEAIGEEQRALVAMSFDFSDLVEDEEDAVIELYDSDDESEFVMATTIADVKKTEAFMNALAAKQEGTILSDTEGYLTLVDTASGSHIILVDEFLVLTNTDDGLMHVIDRYNDEIDSLSDDESYLTAVSFFDDVQLGYAYINIQGLEVSEDLAQAFSLYGFDTAEYQVFGLRAEEDGFSFNTFGQFDKKQLKKLGVDLSSFSGPGMYLDEKLNGTGLMAYAESYNIAQGLKLNPVFADPAISDSFRSFFGTSIEEGLFSWMDKAFGVAFYKGEWILPGLTIAFDASSNLEAAREFFFKLDGQLGGVIGMAQAQGGDFISKKSHDDLTVVSIDVSGLLQMTGQSAFSPTDYPDSLEIAYGLTTDDLFVISIQNGFYENYGQNVIADNESYNRALDVIGGLDGTIAYIDFAGVTDYISEAALAVLETQLAQQKQIDEILGTSEEEALANLEAKESEFRQIVEKIVSVLKQIDFVVSGAEMVGSDQTHGSGYLKLK